MQTLLAPELKAFKYADPGLGAPPMDPLRKLDRVDRLVPVAGTEPPPREAAWPCCAS
ncbi:MAG: hypothetical protein U1F53_12325 [Burkholderiaceae bacterium]